MKEITNKNKAYVIAECAETFEGSSAYLLKQIEKLDGINCIKFHMFFNGKEYAVSQFKELLDYFEVTKLKKEEWVDILKSAKSKGMDTLVLTDDTESVKFCAENNELIDGIEIHAACVNDVNLLNSVINFAKTYNKYMFLGISGFEFVEISEIVEYLKNSELKKVVLMYGFQNFPTKMEYINLCKINYLESITGYQIGYADHTAYNNEDKENIIYSSFAMGTNIQEIHYVLEEGVKKTDYITGVSAERLMKIKEKLDIIAIAKGRFDFRLNSGEKEYLKFRKIPVYARDIQEGEILKESDIVFKRVEKFEVQHKFREVEKYFGSKLNRSQKIETEFREEHIND